MPLTQKAILWLVPRATAAAIERHLVHRQEAEFETLAGEPQPGVWSEFRSFLVHSPAWWLAPLILLLALLGLALTRLPAEAVPFIDTLW